MKKKIFILLTAVCLTEFLPAQESKIPEFLHFSVDFAPALGNGVGQEDGPPYCGGGFWIHPKIGFDIWKSEKVSGVFETGIFFHISEPLICPVLLLMNAAEPEQCLHF